MFIPKGPGDAPCDVFQVTLKLLLLSYSWMHALFMEISYSLQNTDFDMVMVGVANRLD